jgi:hypothetical protein
VAFISGLSLDDDNCYDVNMAMLAEFLVGELDVKTSSRISRLVIAGNSLAPIVLLPPEDEVTDNTKSVSRYKLLGPFGLNYLKLCLVEEPRSDQFLDRTYRTAGSPHARRR